MRVAIVGASGVLGRYLAPRLLAGKHHCVAVVRDPTRLGLPTDPGLTVARADILDPVTLAPAVAGCDAVIHAATRVPRPGGAADWPMNDRIRREGTANLIAACQTAGVGRYVQQSIAMIVPSPAGQLVDEDGPVDAGELQSAIDMEALVMESALDWRILRGGLFYGPGTGAEENWARQAQAGSLLIPGDGSAYMTLVHVADYAEAVVRAVEHGEGRFVLNAVDDQPVTYGAFLNDVARAAGAPAPPAGGSERLESFRASNARARQTLGWRPFFASYRTGLLPGLAPQ
ncbi:MAG TPA: NAD(P)-dependent oxidoreductase [Aestuariivirga sp.]|nr:NAD(P)-dependent oxidoreductase [Alphaproteobacteria bacterium]HRX36374.1 NAD(P)-dependent oxidoreductase [Aestuariivirga sp.]